MGKWEKVYIESLNVKSETTKATLINMPSKSEYRGYAFWHPSKLINYVGTNGYLCEIVFTEEFKFVLKKYGNGKFNFNRVLDEKTIDVEEFKEALGFGVDKNLYNELSD